jgi:hypothetical protein
MPRTKSGLLTLFTYTLTSLFANNVFSFYGLSYSMTMTYDTSQELLIDGAAQFTDSLARVGLDRMKNSVGGRMVKTALKTPKTLLDMITPPSMKALILPLTLPYDLARAAVNLGESDSNDVENVKSVTLIWNNISPR